MYHDKLRPENLDWWKETNPDWVYSEIKDQEIIEYMARSKRISQRDAASTIALIDYFGLTFDRKKLNGPDGTPVDFKCINGMMNYSWDLIEFDSVFQNPSKLTGVYVNCLSCLYPEMIVITGWVWAHELADARLGRFGRVNRKARIYERKRLRPPKTLKEYFLKNE